MPKSKLTGKLITAEEKAKEIIAFKLDDLVCFLFEGDEGHSLKLELTKEERELVHEHVIKEVREILKKLGHTSY